MSAGCEATGRGSAARQAGYALLSHVEQAAYFRALREGLYVLDTRTLSELLGIDRGYAAVILHRLQRKGATQWVGKGRYVLARPETLAAGRAPQVDARLVLPDLLDAAGLAQQYYIGYQSAAQWWGATHQVPHVLQVVIPGRHRPVEVGSARIAFIEAREATFFGLVAQRYQDVRLRLSDRERTALDLVHRPALGGGLEEVARTLAALLSREFDPARLAAYAHRFGRHSVAQRLGYLLEVLHVGGHERVTPALLPLRGRTTIPLEPGGADRGHIDRRWRVRVNLPLVDLEE